MDRNCLYCKQSFYARQSDVAKGKGIYCSVKCSSSARIGKTVNRRNTSGESNPNWKGGAIESAERAKVAIRLYKEKNPKKILAQRLVKQAIKFGGLIKMPCEECGEGKSEAHHCNYNKPLKIMWLCRKHHIQWHKNNKAIT